MQLVMQTSRTCNTGPSQNWGDVVDVPNDEGRRMLKAGHARLLNEQETAMLGGGRENAAIRTGQAKAR